MEKVWEMLADNKIKKLLSDIDVEIDEYTFRLILIEMFSRIKDLELHNFTLRVVLLESEIMDEECFNERLQAAKKYLQERDNAKEKNVDFFAKTGISFVEWASFSNQGTFKKR